MSDYRKLIKQVSTLLTGAILAQILTLVAAPFITRIYSPSEFGLVATFWATGGIIGIVSCLRYETTIIIENDNSNNMQLVFTCILITFFMTTITSIGLVIGYYFFQDNYHLLSNNIIWGLPFLVLMLGLNKVAECVLTKNEKFIYLSTIAVLAVIASTSYKLITGYLFSATYFNLLIGNFIALLFAPVVLYSYLKKVNKIEWQSIKLLLIKYKKFPLIHAPNGFLNALSASLPLIIIAAFLGSEMAGYYAIALLVIQRPIIVFGEALTKVFLKKAAITKGKVLYSDLQKSTLFLVLVGFFPFLIFSYFSDDLFTIIFGSAWKTAGEMSSLLVPWLYCAFINTPSTQTLVSKGKLEVILFYNIANVLRCAMFYLLLEGGYDLKMTILAYSAFGSVTILCLILYTMHIFSPKLESNIS